MAPSFSSSKKLLITNPSPNPKINPSPYTAPPNTASSSSATTAAMPPPEKRTRDQPNLSDCHSCDRRINHTNPKDRLQPMDSVWRIVLLCRKCRKSVHSGQTCPYCFDETGNSGDIVKCNVCDRKIHEVCVEMYANCRPWCYSGVGLGEFRVCVDCWVPEAFKKSIRACGRGENKGGVKDKGDGKDLLGNVKDAKVVAKTKEQALSRAALAKNALDLLEKKGEDLSCSNAVEAVDDAELAKQLHRAMNSSPRISRSHSLNSSGLGGSNIRDCKGLFYKRSRLRNKHREAHAVENESMNQPLVDGSSIDVNGLTQRLLPYKRDKKRKIWPLNDEKTISSYSRHSQTTELEFKPHLNNADLLETAFRVNDDQSNTRINVDRFGEGLVMYKRTKRKVQLNGPCDNNRVVFNSECSQPDNANNMTEAILPNRSCDVERDRCRLKYCRRVMGKKADSNRMHSDTFLSVIKASVLGLSNLETVYALNSDVELSLPNETRNRDFDRYSIKYVRKVKGSKSDSNFDSKVNSKAFMNQNGKSAAGLTMNFSAESSTLSDVSFDSFTTDRPK